MTAFFTAHHFIKDGMTWKQFALNVFVRWLRFGPAVIGILAYDLIWPLIGSGPLYTELTENNTRNCVNNWWTTALLVNNWSKPMEMW